MKESGVMGVRMVAVREVTMKRSAVEGGRKAMEEAAARGELGVYLVPEGKWMEVARVDREQYYLLYTYAQVSVSARLMNGEGAVPIVVKVGEFGTGGFVRELRPWAWMWGMPGRSRWGDNGGAVFEMVPKGVETVEGLEAWRERERGMTTEAVFGLTKVRGCEATRIRGSVELGRRAKEGDGDAAEGLGMLLGDRNVVVRRVAAEGLRDAPGVAWRAGKPVEALREKYAMEIAAWKPNLEEGETEGLRGGRVWKEDFFVVRSVGRISVVPPEARGEALRAEVRRLLREAEVEGEAYRKALEVWRKKGRSTIGGYPREFGGDALGRALLLLRLDEGMSREVGDEMWRLVLTGAPTIDVPPEVLRWTVEAAGRAMEETMPGKSGEPQEMERASFYVWRISEELPEEVVAGKVSAEVMMQGRSHWSMLGYRKQSEFGP